MKKVFLFLFASFFSFRGRPAHHHQPEWFMAVRPTETAFPPKKFTRSIPVPGLIHLATPKIDDYDIWFKKPETAETKQAHGVYDIDYVPKYNWYKKSLKSQWSKAAMRLS
ncbi:MAG: hypothetical protein U5K79_07465 [Cyclobacteriaceae bacterium]|nr:hypothetical protein [Cyclobacteriaceae bacterium]